MAGKIGSPDDAHGPDDQAGASHWVAAAIHRFERPLTAYAARILRDEERARDVVQDAFLRLCTQERDAVEPHLAEWLYTVCRNRALDVRRKEKPMTRASDETLDNYASDQTGPPESMSRREDAARAARFLDQLSENQQEVLRLKFQHGLSYKQISRVTNLSVGNVGFLIHTGLRILRRRMTPQSERETP